MDWNLLKKEEENANQNNNSDVVYNERTTPQTDSNLLSCLEDGELVTTLATIQAGLDAVTVITKNITEIVKVCQQTKYQIALLDRQLDAYIVRSRENIEKYKATIPMLENALSGISNRIDRLTEAVITFSMSKHTTEELKQQQILLDELHNATNSFDQMIMKIILR